MTLFKFAHPDDLPCAFGFAARFLRLRDRSYSAMLRGDAATNSVCMLRHCYIGDCYQSVFLSLSLLRMDPQAAVGPNSNHNGAMKTIGSMGSIASMASMGSMGSVESAGSGRVGNPAEIWADGPKGGGFPAGNANGNTVVNQGNTIANQGNTIANQGNTIANVRLLRVEFAAAAGVFMHRCQQRYHVGLPRGVHGRRKCSGLLRGRDGSLYQISFPSDLVPWGPQPVDSNTGVPIRAAFAGRVFGA